MEKDVYLRHIENEKTHWWFSARKEIIFSILKKIGFKKNLRVLDFGAGSGTNVIMLSKLGRVDVFETEKTTKSYLKLKFKNKKNIRVVDKLKINYYDLILAADVIEHIRNDRKIINIFSKFLKKGGNILVTVPAFNFLFSTKDKALKHYRRYDVRGLTKLLKKKFIIKKLSYFNFFLFIPIAISILILKFSNRKFIKFAETTPNNFINFFLRVVFVSEKYFLKFLKFPFGISIILLGEKK